MAGAEAGWRIVVHLGAAQPELRAALAQVPLRARAERLRQLALVGLYSLHRGSAAAASMSEPQAPQDVALDARRERLLSGLLPVTD
jgi:hypothetical protein